MIAPKQLRDLVITPVLTVLGLPHIPEATELLLATAMQESNCGDAIAQEGGGPALGVWQMEPATEIDVWDNFLAFHQDLHDKVAHLTLLGSEINDTAQLAGNLYYACAMARVQYYRAPEALPAVGDVAGQADLYLLRYNAGGAATAAEFTAAWRRVQAALA